MLNLASKRFFRSAALLLAACGGGGSSIPTTPDAGDTFIAFADDFKGFHQWESFDVTATATPGTVHPQDKLIEYLKSAPAHGSTEFPVGTVLVKEGTDLTAATRKFFAMVKRGGGYNANGAPGWEWFELQNLSDNSGGVNIVWRGLGPPEGDTYGGDPTAGCATCHVACGNDAVCAPALALTQF